MAMDMNYGIGVTNRYALFMGDDESDPLDIISKRKEEEVTTDKQTHSAKGTAHSVQQAAHHQQQQAGGKQVKKEITKKSGAGQHTANTNTQSGKESQSAVGNTGNVNDSKQGKDVFNGGSSSSMPKSKANQSSNKFGSNTNANHGKPVAAQQQQATTKDASNVQGNANNRKGENRSQNRPPRQDRPKREHQANTNTGASQENTWSAGASKDQKEVEEKKNRRNREERPFNPNSDFNRVDRGDDKGKSGRGAFRGGFRGGRGRGGRTGGFDNRGKREFDRQSGSDKTGIKSSEKREGSGSFNWGNFNDELAGQTNPTGDENQEKSSDENIFDGEGKENEVVNEDVEKAKEEEVTEEEQSKEMTYDEWKKLEDEKRAKPIFNLRKPGEGEDSAQWKKTYVLKKKEEDGEEVEYEEIEEEIKHGRQKRILDIEINFKDEGRDARRGRGRGPRRNAPPGGGGGGGDRDRDRGERERPAGGERRGGQGNRRGNQPFRGRDSKEQVAPRVDVNNINDFPSLAAA